MAYKSSENGQFSLAYGDFYQSTNSDILKFAEGLKPQQTKHYIINYQLNKEGQIFRAEAFYKDYKNLVKYDTEFTAFDSNYNNSGKGFAKGIDQVWENFIQELEAITDSLIKAKPGG